MHNLIVEDKRQNIAQYMLIEPDTCSLYQVQRNICIKSLMFKTHKNKSDFDPGGHIYDANDADE